MELRHLRYFVAVAEEQNVTRAAARLHVSQPPLSRQIRDLEDELGVALFDHGAKAVRLTEVGRVFLTEARAVRRRADEAAQTVKAVASGQRGEIHVGYAPSLTVELLPRALRFFQEANPGVRVQLHDLSTQEMLRGLRDGKLHVALLIQLAQAWRCRRQGGAYRLCRQERGRGERVLRGSNGGGRDRQRQARRAPVLRSPLLRCERFRSRRLQSRGGL